VAPPVLRCPVQIVGRLAPQIARLLMGKHKPTYMPHVDCGDCVVVTNSTDAVLTGNKMQTKLYRWHTQYPGGLKSLTARQMHERAPERLIEIAVKGMLPPNNMRDLRMKRLRIVRGEEHDHAWQAVASKMYAPEYVERSKPRSFTPPPKKVTGTLVKDVFPGVRDNKQLEKLGSDLKPIAAEESLRALDAEFARLAAAAAASPAAGSTPKLR